MTPKVPPHEILKFDYRQPRLKLLIEAIVGIAISALLIGFAVIKPMRASQAAIPFLRDIWSGSMWVFGAMGVVIFLLTVAMVLAGLRSGGEVELGAASVSFPDDTFSKRMVSVPYGAILDLTMVYESGAQRLVIHSEFGGWVVYAGYFESAAQFARFKSALMKRSGKS